MKLILKLLVFLFGIAVSGQTTFIIFGSVNDFHNKTPLQNAKITIAGQTVFSDAKGKFRISKIEGGKYILIAEHSDCDTYEQEILVNRNLDLTINLEHHAEEIESVNLTALRQTTGNVVVSTLGAEEISQNYSENLGNLLSGVSGVSALKTGNNITKPIIHGLYGSRVSMVNNGVKMAEQEWGVEHAPSVETSMFDKIKIVKGSGILKYGGDAVGGAVILEPKIFPAKDTLLGEVLLSAISSGRGLKVGTNLAKTWGNRWFVKTGGTYKKLGDLYIPHHTLQNTGTEEQSFNFSFGNRNFKQGFELSYSGVHQDFGIFSGSHLGSPDDMFRVLQQGGARDYYDSFGYQIANPRQEISHHIAKIEAYKRFYNLGKFSLQYAFQLNNRKEYDIRRGELSGLPSMDLRLATHQLKLEHLIEREHWQLESGIFAEMQDNFPNPATKARRIIPDYYRYDVGAFSIFNYKINEKWKAELGARYDFNRYDAYKYYDQTDWDARFSTLFPQFVERTSGSRVLTRPVLDFHNISANAGLSYKPSEISELKINLSRASRTPNAAELFADGLHHSAAIIEIGSLAMKKEVVYQINLSAKTQLNVLDGLRIGANPYIMLSDNFINQIPTGVQNSNRGVFMIWSYQQTKARIFGIDADAQLQLNRNWKWTSQFSALRGDDLQNNEPLILMMPANFRNAVEFYFNQNKKAFVKLENETVLKQNRFPERNVSLSRIENGVIVNRVLDISSTPSGYSLFHFSAGAEVFKNFNINFRIQNLFNKEYREYLNRLRFFAPEQGRNFILTFKYQF
ncbi:MAG: TonB-dependent receptor [Cruoricaptor ignavus]|nr:TonB-dependent receptor [Cruoricaptor ignavus]